MKKEESANPKRFQKIECPYFDSCGNAGHSPVCSDERHTNCEIYEEKFSQEIYDNCNHIEESKRIREEALSKLNRRLGEHGFY